MTKIKKNFATSEDKCTVMWNKKLKKENQFTSIQSQKIRGDFSEAHVSSLGDFRWKLTHHHFSYIGVKGPV